MPAQIFLVWDLNFHLTIKDQEKLLTELSILENKIALRDAPQCQTVDDLKHSRIIHLSLLEERYLSHSRHEILEIFFVSFMLIYFEDFYNCLHER